MLGSVGVSQGDEPVPRRGRVHVVDRDVVVLVDLGEQRSLVTLGEPGPHEQDGAHGSEQREHEAKHDGHREFAMAGQEQEPDNR